MERVALHEVAFARLALSNRLPFRLGGQARTRPTGKRIGFVAAEVRHRRVHHQRAGSRQRVLVPGTVDLAPVERRLPVALPHRRPSIAEPQVRALIALILHELQILAIRHQTIRQLKGTQKRVVTGRFVIERKPTICTDRNDPTLMIDPASGVCAVGRARRVQVGAVGGQQRVVAEVELQVGQHQLLMLLLMMEAQLGAP